MSYLMPDHEYDRALLRAFGIMLRRSRLMAGLSQVVLSERSGVSQAMVSRLERGAAPAASVFKIVRLGDAIGIRWPLGFCPHHHYCCWRPLREDGTEDHRHEPIGSEDYFRALMEDGSD